MSFKASTDVAHAIEFLETAFTVEKVIYIRNTR